MLLTQFLLPILFVSVQATSSFSKKLLAPSPLPAPPKEPLKALRWPYEADPEHRTAFKKDEKKKEQTGVCVTSYFGLHLVYDSTFYGDAEAACQSYGFVLARLGNSTVSAAQAILYSCSESFAAIASYNGFGPAPLPTGNSCLYLNNGQLVDYVEGFISCSFITGPVLCQEGEISSTTKTITTTALSTTTTTTVSTISSSSSLSVTTTIVLSTGTSTTSTLLIISSRTLTSVESDISKVILGVTSTTDTDTLTVTETNYFTDEEIGTLTTITTVSVYSKPSCPHKPLWACPCQPQDGLVIIESKVSFHQAECACRLLGLELANIDIFNFMKLSALGNDCLGQNSYGWIRSWNGDLYSNGENETCLAFFTGSTNGAGAIAVPANCYENKPVICQAPQGQSCGSCEQDSSEWCGCSSSSPSLNHSRRHHRRHKPAPTRCYDKNHPIPLAPPMNLVENVSPTQCVFTTNNMHLIQNLVYSNNTASLCSLAGLVPADINVSNAADAKYVLSKCGVNNGAWIDSYLGQAPYDPSLCISMEYNFNQIALYRLATNPMACMDIKPVLCSVSAGSTTTTGTVATSTTATSTLTQSATQSVTITTISTLPTVLSITVTISQTTTQTINTITVSITSTTSSTTNLSTTTTTTIIGTTSFYSPTVTLSEFDTTDTVSVVETVTSTSFVIITSTRTTTLTI